MTFEGLQLSQYRLQRLLGSGGMGEVYLAEDVRIQQQVAIKIIGTEASFYPNRDALQDAIRLFQREAKFIARLDHPHILPLFSYGEENVRGMAFIYLVMPYRPEGSLANWLQERKGPILLPIEEVVFFMNQAADALQYAHDHQIIHRDVKPSNFLVRTMNTRLGHPDLLLADFGIAQFSGAISDNSRSIEEPQRTWLLNNGAEKRRQQLTSTLWQFLRTNCSPGTPPLLGNKSRSCISISVFNHNLPAPLIHLSLQT